jgi:hypothetical protein
MFPNSLFAVNEQFPVYVLFTCRAVTLESVPDGGSPMPAKPVVFHTGLFPDL